MSTGRVAIVGAGIGGLHLAHRLVADGTEPVVFEAADRPGGVIHTVIERDRVLELGPQRTRLSPALRRLTTDLGLGDRIVTAPPDLPLFVYRAGRLRRAPLSFAGLLRTDLLSRRTKLRVLLEPFTSPDRGEETVARYLTRRFGRTAYEDLLGPLFGGLYASDPADMLVRHALAPVLRDLGTERSAVATLARRGFRRATSSAPLSFRGGMADLAAAMHTRVREHVRLGVPVRGVRRAGRGFEVLSEDGAHLVDHVVFTSPADVTAALLRDLAPDAAGRLDRLRYNHLAVVHLLSDAGLRGLGFQTSFAERIETRGVTFNHALFGAGREQVYTAFLGGARNPAMVEATDAMIGDIALAEFHRITGSEAEVVRVSRTRIPAWDRSWTALEGLHLPPGLHLCANYESRVGIPGRLARADALAGHLGGAEAEAA